jgi:hypothetical protein
MIGTDPIDPASAGFFIACFLSRELVSVSKRVGGQGECNEPKAARVRE